jgi:hypothetical protein
MKRPPRKEQHWEIGLLISVYYGLKKNMMASAESDLVIQYFKENNGKQFLSPRPKAFDSKDSKQMHDFGAKMTTYSKPRMFGLIQSFVEDCVYICFFNELINNILAYDYENIGTDWDDVDALGLALMRIVDMRQKPEKEGDMNTYEDEMGLGEYIVVGDNVIDKGDYDDSLDQDFSSMF